MAKKKKSKKYSMNLIKNEISRCNQHLLTINIFLTIGAAFIISIFFYDLGINGKVILVIAGLAIPSYNYYNLYIRFKDYKNHPIYISLLRFKDPEDVAHNLEGQMKSSAFFKNNDIEIYPNWIIIRSYFNFMFIHSSEIYWAYLKKTKHSINFIPTGTTNGLVIHSIYPVKIDFDSKESEKILETIYSMAPWAMYGYSEELKNLWDEDKSSFISMIHVRINELMKGNK
jgi:hypothetical protein